MRFCRYHQYRLVNMRELESVLISRQCVSMNLHASRSFFGILWVDLVKPKDLASRGVELVVVDLD